MSSKYDELEDLRRDLESVVRVRNRLADTGDDKLPRVLAALLPKLLKRVDQTATTILRHHHNNSNSRSGAGTDRTRTEQACQQCRNQMLAQLTGMISYAHDRIQLLRGNTPAVVGRGGDQKIKQQQQQQQQHFVHTIAPLLKDFQSKAATSMCLSLLQVGLPHCYCSRDGGDDDNDGAAKTTIIRHLIPVVDRTHATLYERDGQGSDAEAGDGNRTAAATCAQMHYRNSGWLLLEAIGRACGLPSALADPPAAEGAEPLPPWEQIQASALHADEESVDAMTRGGSSGGVGVFHLLLDVLLFLPPPTYRHRNDDIVASLDNSTGLSLEGLARMNHHHRDGGGGSSRITHDEAYLQQLKYGCLKYAILPRDRCLFRYSREPQLSCGSDRALILAILTAGGNTMYGRLSTSYLHQCGNDMILNRARERSWNTCSSTFRISTSLACCLLILVLGDEAAASVLDKHSTADLRFVWENTLGCLPSESFLRRSPLPVHVASRAVSFIRDHYRVRDFPSEVHAIKLFVDLVVAMQDPKRHGVYWGIQLINGLFDDLRKNTDRREDDWMSGFYRCCFETAKSVLKVVPEHYQGLTEAIAQDRRGDDRPLGVPEPYGQRNDLNKLIKNHRAAQKKRLLNQDAAIHAREKAYQMISELCSIADAGSTENGEQLNFDVCRILFNWSLNEAEGNQKFLEQALDSLLRIYRACLTPKDGKESCVESMQQQVATLLPCLLICASSDSAFSRRLVVKYARDLLADADPGAALHICSFLASDADYFVSQLADATIKEKLSPDLIKPSSDSKQNCGVVEFCDEEEVRQYARLDLDCRVNSLMVEFGLTRDESCVVLFENNFSVDAASRALKDNFSTTLCSYGLVNQQGDETDAMEIDEAVCGICYDDALSSLDSYSLACGHKFCRSCWSGYLKNGFEKSDSLNPIRLTCPHHRCGLRLLSKDIQSLNEELLNVRHEAFLSSFMEKSERYRPCPGPDCDTYSFCSTTNTLASPTCPSCSTSFCFHCGCKPHTPAPCDSYIAWNQIFTSDFWVKKNSKPCPSCHSPIEKNGGCNHMDCGKCGTAFCWLCLSLLRTHQEPHTCNMYDPVADRSDADDEDARALFFTGRYDAHDEAQIVAQRQCKELQHSADKMESRFPYVSNEQYSTLFEAIETLVKARSFLKFSYVAAWSRPDKSFFEIYQSTLESVTERVNYMTERHLDRIFHEDGPYGIDLHFRALSFHMSSLNQYMDRMMHLMNDRERD